MKPLLERLEDRRLFANPHFVSATSTDNGTTLTVDGKLAGLGTNDQVTLAVTAEGTATVFLVNPAGHVKKHPQTLAVTVSGELITFSDQNGAVLFSVTTIAPTAEGAPNSKWTTTVTDVQFSSAEVLYVEEGVSTAVPV